MKTAPGGTNAEMRLPLACLTLENTAVERSFRDSASTSRRQVSGAYAADDEDDDKKESLAQQADNPESNTTAALAPPSIVT